MELIHQSSRYHHAYQILVSVEGLDTFRLNNQVAKLAAHGQTCDHPTNQGNDLEHEWHRYMYLSLFYQRGLLP